MVSCVSQGISSGLDVGKGTPAGEGEGEEAVVEANEAVATEAGRVALLDSIGVLSLVVFEV